MRTFGGRLSLIALPLTEFVEESIYFRFHFFFAGLRFQFKWRCHDRGYSSFSNWDAKLNSPNPSHAQRFIVKNKSLVFAIENRSIGHVAPTCVTCHLLRAKSIKFEIWRWTRPLIKISNHSQSVIMQCVTSQFSIYIYIISQAYTKFSTGPEVSCSATICLSVSPALLKYVSPTHQFFCIQILHFFCADFLCWFLCN